MGRRSSLVATTVAGLVLVACGGADGGIAGSGSGENDPAAMPFDPATVRYDCFGVGATADEIATAPSVAELDGHPAAAAFAGLVGDVEGWQAIEVSDDQLGAIRRLDPPDEMDGEVRDHERRVVEQMGEAGGLEADADGWMVTSAGPCALRAEMDGLLAATVLLDPDAPPTAEDTSVALWVVEQACASGGPATGRVAAAVEPTDDEVRLIIGIEPPAGDQSCPSNPATRVTVELGEPLGERALVDVARLPPIELRAPPPGLDAAP